MNPPFHGNDYEFQFQLWTEIVYGKKNDLIQNMVALVVIARFERFEEVMVWFLDGHYDWPDSLMKELSSRCGRELV